ncbi:VQ motif-containing protein 31-like [Papaver somniferum]|uniref:VQ motif-containing protein 31-like n=1 Tax=Papaver somniferum TaxID=3469 RepID=UPI000E6F5151|nr:VQ motif-containing protein 31-like [Papaver somniferum]
MEKPTSNQDSTPLTTFVQADTNTFRELVQRLTGSSDRDHGTSNVPPQSNNNAVATNESTTTKVIGVKKPTFKLHERRQYSKTKLEVVNPGFQFRPGSPILSPSRPGLHKTKLLPSPTKVANYSPIPSPSQPFANLSILEEKAMHNLPSDSLNNEEEEEKAIQEMRFYLHPSPRSKTSSEPELLTLFPLTSPKSHQP